MYIVTTVIIILIFCKNVSSYYCVVPFNSPGISISDSEMKKDNAEIGTPSKYNLNSIEFNLFNSTEVRNISNWKLFNSIENTIADTPALDRRWENFINNHNNSPKDIREILKKPHQTIFLSVRVYTPNKILGLDKEQWYHLKSNESGIYSCNNSSCEKQLSAMNAFDYYRNGTGGNFWKVHNYKYYLIKNETTDYIYNKSDNCTASIQKGCIFIYLAMCRSCKMSLQITTNDKFQRSIVQGNGTWTETFLCTENLTDCFTLSVETLTTNATNPFWVIGERGHIVEYSTKCSENVRYIEVNPTNPSTSHHCEDVWNQEIKLYEQNETWTTEGFCAENPSLLRNEIKSETNLSASLNYLYYLIFLPLTVASASIFVCIYKERKNTTLVAKFLRNENMRLLPHQQNQTVGSRDFENNDDASSHEYNYPKINFLREDSNMSNNLVFYTNSNDSMWSSIKPTDFHSYVDWISSSHHLENQFHSLPSGYLYEHSEGMKKKNIVKNKSPNTVPYDKNRVKLKDKQLSTADYINASYIQGFSNYKEYIVTQNPLQNTVDDFWSMIWQTNVIDIIKITTKDEEYYQYWPKYKDTSLTLGNIEIFLEEVVIYEFYIQRKLKVRKSDCYRKINHLHYFAWPKDDSTLSSQIFVKFMDQLLRIPHFSSPVLVHCIDGGGRSGSIVLCDIVLRALPGTGTIDLYSAFKTLRECRANMVLNVEQYRMVHFVVRDVLNRSK